MKKKILFISTRNPYSGRYSGDVIRSLKIINLLKKKYFLKIVCLEDEEKILKEKELISFKVPNLFHRIFFCLVSFLKLQPLHFGLFYSSEMKNFIEDNANEYDLLFFYHIRSSQYLPNNYYGETIIEMGDLYSDNYNQTFQNLNPINPLKYIYYFESILVRKLEEHIFSKFDKIILFSKSEIQKIDKQFKNKIFQINESIEKIRNCFSFSKNNFRILFVGNLNYLPNFLACKNFIRKILPKVKKEIPGLKFCVIGDIKRFKKKLLSNDSSVEILGAKKNLTKYTKTAFCGLANLKIATGVQGKVLTYMSHGLPVICSSKVSKNFGQNVISYEQDLDLISKLILLKNNRSKSNKLSTKSIKFAKNHLWKKISQDYFRLINN